MIKQKGGDFMKNSEYNVPRGAEAEEIERIALEHLYREIIKLKMKYDKEHNITNKNHKYE